MSNPSMLTWSQFKSLFLSKSGKLQFIEDDLIYFVFFFDGQTEYGCSLPKDIVSADTTDFENNYKAQSNQRVGIPEYDFNDNGRIFSKSKLQGSDGTVIGNIGNRLNVEPEVDYIYQMVALRNTSNNKQMAVNGATTNVNFQYAPPAGQTWEIEGISIFISDSGTPDPNDFGSGGGLFGGDSALENGLILEVRSKGNLYTLCNLTDNRDIAGFFPEHGLIPAASGGFFNTVYCYSGYTSFKNRIILNGDNSDFIRFRVRDNLTFVDFLNSSVKVRRKI